MVTCTLGEDEDNFYVVETDGNSVQMLTELNLDTTTYKQSTSVGDIAFSTTNYCTSVGYSPAGNSEYNYVYDRNSKLYPIVEGYVSYLKSNGVSSASGKLLSYEQATNLGRDISKYSCSSVATWVYSTRYWLGSASFSNYYPNKIYKLN